jgi:hypothetical protein
VSDKITNIGQYGYSKKKNNAKRYLLALSMKYLSPKVGIGRDC